MEMYSELVTIIVVFSFLVGVICLMSLYLRYLRSKTHVASSPATPVAFSPGTPSRSSSVFVECGISCQLNFSPEPNPPQTREDGIPQLIAAAHGFMNFENARLDEVRYMMEEQMYHKIGEGCLRFLICCEAYGVKPIPSFLYRMHVEKVDQAAVVSTLRRAANDFKKKFQKIEDETLKEARFKLSKQMFNDIGELRLRYLLRAEAFSGESILQILCGMH